MYTFKLIGGDKNLDEDEEDGEVDEGEEHDSWTGIMSSLYHPVPKFVHDLKNAFLIKSHFLYSQISWKNITFNKTLKPK